MSKLIFTDAALRSLPIPESGRMTYWSEQCPGFGVRVGVTGRKTFLSKINADGQSKIVTHGIYPSTSLMSAMAAHDVLVKKVVGGTSIGDLLSSGKDVLVRLAIDDFYKYRTEHGFKDAKNQYNMLIKDVVPHIGGRMMAAITVKDIRNCFDLTLRRIRKDRPDDQEAGLSHIKHLQVAVRGLFKWAAAKGMIEVSPAAGMESVGVSRVRERVLEPAEIFKFWNGISVTGCETYVIEALKFMMVTGQRSKEVRSLRWSDLSDDGKIWTITAGTAKNKRMHRVPLGKLALGILKGIKSAAGNAAAKDGYVFGGAKMISERALSKAMLRNRNVFGVDNVTPHDLRRTAATLVAAMGLPSFYASLLLNHAQQGVTNRVYVQYSYDVEKKKAVDVLDSVISSIIKSKSSDSVPDLDRLRKSVKLLIEK